MIIAGMAISNVGILVAICSPNLLALELGVLLGGFGMSAIFPTAIAIFTEWFGTGGTGSIVFGLCGLGGALVPWLVGIVSNRSHNLRLGLTVPIACLALATLVFWLSARMVEPDRRAESAPSRS